MRRLMFAVLCAAAVFAAESSIGAGTPSPPPSAKTVIAKLAAAYGGLAVLDGIRTQVVKASVTIGGEPATLVATAQAPNKIIQVIEIPSAKVKFIPAAYDGTTAWAMSEYGDVAALTGDKATAVMCDAIEQNDPLLHPDRWPVTTKLEPTRVIDGKSYLVLSVTPKGCRTITELIDPKTYLIMREEAAAQTISYSNFKKGPLGETYAATVVVTGGMGVILATVTSVQDNVTLDPSVFAMPPQPSASPSSAAPAAIPSPTATPSRSFASATL